MLCFAEFVGGCGTAGGESAAGGESEPASAARRWLARNAAAVRHLYVDDAASATACTSLVTCMPALERVDLLCLQPMVPNDLRRLLEALACCPRLGDLQLHLTTYIDWLEDHKAYLVVDTSTPNLWSMHSLAPFAKLRSLTKLTLGFGKADFYHLPNVVGALVSLTGLTELSVCLRQPAVVPAALGQLTKLQSLVFAQFTSCVLEAGCFDLPALLSLGFIRCHVGDAEVLANVPALPSLSSITFKYGSGPPFAAQLFKLPRLQCMVFETSEPCAADYNDAYLGRPRLPAGSALRHLSLAGHGLTQFPLVLTQLVALEHLDLRGNGFAELPDGITALARLTELTLGDMCPNQPF